MSDDLRELKARIVMFEREAINAENDAAAAIADHDSARAQLRRKEADAYRESERNLRAEYQRRSS